MRSASRKAFRSVQRVPDAVTRAQNERFSIRSGDRAAQLLGRPQ